MTKGEQNRIKSFVMAYPKTEKSMILIGIFATLTLFPMFAYYCSLESGEKLFQSNLVYLLIIAFLNVIISIVTIVTMKKHPIIVSFYEAFSSLAFSSAFFTTYYYFIYKILKFTSPFYIIFAIVGEVVILVALFIYRYKIYKGDLENKGGKPKYSWAISAIFPGIIFFKAIMSNASEMSENILLAIIALFVSYAMSVGIVFIMNFIIGFKYRKEIDFTLEDSEQISIHSKNSKKKRNNKK